MERNVKELIKSFEKQRPNTTVEKIVDFDEDHYIVFAPDGDNDMDCWYGMNKSDNKAVNFFLANDLNAFIDAVENRTIYER